MTKPRVFPANLIPPDIWKDRRLRLPALLYSTYRSELARVATALRGANIAGPNIGGASAEETLIHFRDFFENSAGRACVAALDPENTFAPLADYLQQSLSDGAVAILDVPCGAGATTAGLLALMTDLRSRKIVATTPLNISILGADLSPTAIEQYRRVMADLVAPAEAQGIHVTSDAVEWNARDRPSTEALCARWLNADADVDEFIVLVSNFSGANADPAFFAEFERSFEYICTRLANRRYTVFWIEPCSKDARKKLLGGLRRLFSSVMKSLTFSPAPTPEPPCCDYEIWKDSQAQFIHTTVTFARITRV